jgi:hypothetical protein
MSAVIHKKHMVISDCQVKDGVDLSYLERIGKFAAEKKPDVIVCIGDFADMPSLSSYDAGKKSFEGRRYIKDIDAAKTGMAMLMGPIQDEICRTIAGHRKRWNPQLVLTLGNHEHRIERAVESDPKLDGTIGIEDLEYEAFGWTVVPFLEPIMIDGIAYAHYFTSGVMGRPVASARQLVQKKHMSCVMGHVQNWDIHREVRADGVPIVGLFSGSTYTHNEDYLGPQGNNYSRGLWMLYEVKDGSFDPHHVTLNYLEQKYP